MELVAPGGRPAEWNQWSQERKDASPGARRSDRWYLLFDGVAGGNGSGDPVSAQRGPGQIGWNDQDLPQRLTTMKVQGGMGRGDRTAHLMLTDQSGAKRKVPQPSIGAAMIEAEQAMRRPGCRLRAVKVVRRHTAVARWKLGKQGWHRVA